MIIAILDDGGVMIHAELADVQREHEGIDVEDEAVKFYDAAGWRLRPVFAQPNIRSAFVVASGQYHLEPAENAPGELLAALSAAAYLEPSAVFSSLQEVRDHVRTLSGRDV